MGNINCFAKNVVDDFNIIERRSIQIDDKLKSCLSNFTISDQYVFLNPPIEKTFYYEVRKARHKQTKAEKGVMILNIDKLGEGQVERYLTTINILKGLDHPNIVKIHDIQMNEDNIFAIQELCNGPKLSDKFISRGRDEDFIANIIQQILGTLLYCEQRKIIHGEINYSNIRFQHKGEDSMIKVRGLCQNECLNRNLVRNMDVSKLQFFSPDALDGTFNSKQDVWSIGIIMYHLLTGEYPYSGQNQKEIIKNIKSKGYAKNGQYQKLSKNAQHLIDKMLSKSSFMRINLRDALDHPFIKQNTKSEVTDKLLMDQFGQFDDTNNATDDHQNEKLQELIWNIIMKFFVSNQEMRKIQEIFRDLDDNKDGVLSREELFQGFKNAFGEEAAQKKVDSMMQQFDKENKGVINYNSFIMASVNRQQMLTDENIQTFFNTIDEDGSGEISKEELMQQFNIDPKNYNKELWKDISRGIYFDENDNIQYEEFRKFLINVVSRKKQS